MMFQGNIQSPSGQTGLPILNMQAVCSS